MRWIARCLLLAVMLLGCLDVCGQLSNDVAKDGVLSPASPAKPEPLARGSVAGRVTLADLRGPARGAHVMLMPAGQVKGGGTSGPLMTVTGLDGSFLVEHVAPGEYFVLAFAAGYLSPMDGVQVTMDNPGADTAGLEKKFRENATEVRVQGVERARAELELRRGAVLSGRVTYADGMPASQLAVIVERTDQDTVPGAKSTVDAGAIFRQFILTQRNATDDEGRFRIAGLAPGSYRVAIPQQSSSGSVQEQLETFGAMGHGRQLTYYSGDTLHPKAAKAYKLAAGETVDGVDITLPLSGLHTVGGVLSSKDGQSINYASVTLEDTADAAISFHTSIDAVGGFRFENIPEGTYTLKVMSAGFTTNPAAFQIPPEMIDRLEGFRRSRAYADQTMTVMVQTTDIENLALTMVEIKVPDVPKAPTPGLVSPAASVDP